MERTINRTDSKYIKPSRQEKIFTFISFAFFFTLFVLPQYFGMPFPVFDLTALRIMIILMFLFILGNKQRQKQSIEQIAKAPYSKVLIPYMIVLTYTLVLRADINALLNPLIEIISFYLMVYVIKYCFGIKRTLEYILFFSYIIAFLGLVEFVIQRSPFSYLETITGLYTGRFFRSGNYRIMGPLVHSLGYGLMLITMIPVICYDTKKEEINILCHKLLFILTAVNIFLTGSRSTLSVFLVEVIVLALFSTKRNIKKLILIGSVFLVVFVSILVIFQNSSLVRNILLQITSVTDELFGTTYSIKYGANLDALSSSSNYRDQLKYIFQVDWLNPLVGLGRKRSFSCEINGSYIHSVDSFYIAEFIRYAYPGMISFILFLLYFLIRMIKIIIQKKSHISKMLFAGSICYCINLLWVDSLQTLKYLYILFAIFCCLPENFSESKRKKQEELPSKYIKTS